MLRLLQSLVRPRQKTVVTRRRPTARPALEMLEDRCAPALLTVNSVADNTSSDNVLTLREAIMAVDGTRSLSTGEKALVTGTLGQNDTIQFNLPSGPQTITLTGGVLSITKNVAINGPGAGSLTINGKNSGRVFLVGHDYTQSLGLQVSMSGLTIARGSATSGKASYGGGLLNFGTLNVSDCTFTANQAGSSGGGAIYNDGAMNVANCIFATNTVTNGGTGAGILVTSSANLTVTGSTFIGGNATGGGEGGGIANNGVAKVTYCTFSNNSVGSNGAGIHNTSSGKLNLSFSTFTGGSCVSDGGGFDSDGSAIVSYCTFANNTVGSEGGAIDSHGSLVISNSTIAGNTAVSRGGGINISGASHITNCTITGNRVASSSGKGGGFYDSTAANLFNTIVAGNFVGSGATPNDIIGNVASGSSFNLIGIGGAGGMKNGTKGNQVGITNPGLDALANNGGPTQTMALLAGSPAIDRGGNNFVSGSTDQRGLARIVNGTVDIGALEVQLPAGPTASTFALSGFPASIQAGATATITVTAISSTNSVATGYTGTIHFTSSDPQAVVPADYTFLSGDNGVHTFSVTLKTAGSQSITITDTQSATITSTQSGITVAPAAASMLAVTDFASPTTAGTAGTFAVTARDAFGNVATGYLGAIHFTSSDAQAALPGDYQFTSADRGVHTFRATLQTAGSQSIAATDTASGISGTQDGITVTPASASTLIVSGFPSPTKAGASGSFSVTVQDAFGNTVTGYAGTINFFSSDGAAVLPADYTFEGSDNGVHSFNATFITVGTQTLTATDKANAAITGTQSAISVNPAAFASLTVAGFPSSTTAGASGSLTVTARDSLGNIVTNYDGTIHFSSSDPQANLPADYTFSPTDNGVHNFTATLFSAGTQTISVRDAAAGVNGSESGITVTPASAMLLDLAGFPSPAQVGGAGAFTVTLKDGYGNTATGYLGTIHFTSTDSTASLPDDYTFAASDNGVHTFSAIFNSAGTQTLTATDTVRTSIAGSQTGITVNPAPSGPVLLVNSGADNTTADNFLTLREAIAVVDGTLGRSLTAGEQAQITGTLGSNDAIQFNLPAGTQTITLTGGALDITQPVAINGPGAANLTISGNNADRVFIVGHDYSQNLSLNVAMSGVTISGGKATVSGKNYGGGLLNFGTLTLDDVTFASNTAGSSGGGAIYNDGALTVTNSTFTANAVVNGGSGGGIQNTSSAQLTVTNCTFTGNTGTGGAQGAALANSGHLTVIACNITGNTADSNAGGIYNSSDGSLSVTTSTVANNSGGSDGGGIDNDGAATIAASTISGNLAGSEGGGLGNKGSLTVTNCTFYGNTAVSDGGGLQSSGTATITNCTVTANRVTSGSGGIFGGGIYAATAIRIFNTIVAGNFRGAAPSTTADDFAGNADSTSAFNLIGIGGAGGMVDGVNNNLVGVANVGLAGLADNGGPTLTVALNADSPAIDHGGNIYVTAGESDERGLLRIVNGTVDIGAFEVQ